MVVLLFFFFNIFQIVQSDTDSDSTVVTDEVYDDDDKSLQNPLQEDQFDKVQGTSWSSKITLIFNELDLSGIFFICYTLTTVGAICQDHWTLWIMGLLNSMNSCMVTINWCFDVKGNVFSVNFKNITVILSFSPNIRDNLCYTIFFIFFTFYIFILIKILYQHYS